MELRFANLGSLAAPPDPANYEAVYTREVYPDDDTGRILENFYYIFNDERPGDFVGHSLSVSDIVALKQDGKVSYHYCDSMGFQELPAFQKPENYLKAAEMSMEDDYGMIDGITEKITENPTIKLIAAIPYQRRLDTLKKSERTKALIDLCTEIYIAAEEYHPSVYAKRNRYMVEHSDRIIAVYDGREKGGTVGTIRLAHRMEKELREITAGNLVIPAHLAKNRE